jgi:hypothetical protein
LVRYCRHQDQSFHGALPRGSSSAGSRQRLFSIIAKMNFEKMQALSNCHFCSFEPERYHGEAFLASTISRSCLSSSERHGRLAFFLPWIISQPAVRVCPAAAPPQPLRHVPSLASAPLVK